MAYERINLDTFDVADSSNTYDNHADSVPHPRPAFRRQSSNFALTPPERTTGEKNVKFRSPSPVDTDDYDQARKEGGLGISYVPTSPERIKRVPVGSKETLSSTYSTPEMASGRTSQATTYQNTPNSGSQAYLETPDTEMLREQVGGMGGFACPTQKDILDPKMSWLSISIMILAIYSTIFSALYLIIAMWKPRWGQNIGTYGHLSYSTASLLSALFAKTIELSFVTVFVTVLGQALSRRAFRKSRTTGGISIAEMTMRTWVMQPGTLITHWESLRHSALSVLGGITLLAAFAGIFYTTAAEALVAPKLKDGSLHRGVLQGLVAASFANAPYLESACQTPVTRTNINPDTEGTTCLQLEHSGQGYHNLKSFLDNWAYSNSVGNMSNTTSYDMRPQPIAMLYDNTTVQGQWIQSSADIQPLSQMRLIQNLTMAMPHANIFNAARNPKNGILQPDDLGGAGQYTLTAAVAVPATNVLCVGMTAEELAPIVYTAWKSPTGENYTLDPLEWPQIQGDLLNDWMLQPNQTVVDPYFHFNESVDYRIQYAPVFPKYPIDYNTVVSWWQSYGQLSVYLLAKPALPAGPTINEYVMCSVRAIIYSNCSTKYSVENSGGHLAVHCDDDPENTMNYLESQPLAPLTVEQADWKDIATEWIKSISLSQGIADGNASGARLLTQTIPPDDPIKIHLLPNMPSIGEALSVLAGCTLLLSSSMSPFIHYWSFSEPTLEAPQPQAFNASIISREYASGGTQHWQGIFYVILVAVFIMNLLCVMYLFRTYCVDGQVTDFTEPQNLFSLAINSPPSYTMAGTCGAGPDRHTLGKRWQVGMQKDETNATAHHPHFYVKFPDDEWAHQTPVLDRRKAKRRVRRMEGFEVEESPAIEQYMRLSGKWGSIL